MSIDAAIRREIPFASGLRVLSSVQDGGEHALSDYASCIVPLLNALGWRGDERHLAEAVPHFSDNLDLDGVINVFANLRYALRPAPIRQDRIDSSMLPCLFVPGKGSVRVILAEEEDGFRIYDGWTRSERRIARTRLAGSAYVAQAMAAEPVGSNAERSWTHQLFSRFSSLLWLVLLITGSFNVLSIATPIFIMSVYDSVVPSGSTTQLLYFTLGIGLALTLEMGFRILRARLMGHVAGRIDYAIGTESFRQVLHLPGIYTESAPLGGQLARLREFEAVREMFTGPLAEALLDLPFVVLFLIVIAILGGVLVTVPIAVGVAFVGLHILMSAEMRRAVAGANRYKSELQQMMVETIHGIRALKLSSNEGNWIERYRAASANAAMAEFRSGLVTNTVHALAQSLMLAAGMALVALGSFMVMAEELTLGALIAVMALGWRSLSPLQSGFLALNRTEQVRTAFRQINQLMRLASERPPGEVPPRRSIYGELTFAGVSHRYTGDSDPVLYGVSFEIKPGEVVAFAGRNGSGKSTVLKLASGQYRVQSGAVMLDGTDIRQIDPIDLRQHLGVMPQEPQFFYGTISQNMRLVDPTATDERIERAAREARVHADILDLPDGYETRLNERVLGELPIGFKQKLSLSRALLRDAPVLVLDEPGQSLDDEGDEALIRAIERRRGLVTVLMVTHRPSHMKIADRLIILENGRVGYDDDPAKYFQMAKMGPG